MNKLLLLCTSLVGISMFPPIPTLASTQPLDFTLRDRQTNASVSGILKTLSTLQKESLPTKGFPAQQFLATTEDNELDPAEVDCNNTPSDLIVKTSEGFRYVRDHCQILLSQRQQQTANVQKALPWQQPYWLNGNVCRDRQADTVCFTPSEAAKLRWNSRGKE